MRSTIVFTSLFLISIFPGYSDKKPDAGDSFFPSDYLFFVERNRDADKIFYSVNFHKNGDLNLRHPIDVYWIKFTKDNQKAPLTRVQNNFYGLRFTSLHPGEIRFHFAAIDNRTFKLSRKKNGEFGVFTSYKGEWVELKKMYVHFSGGTYLLPILGHVELHYKEPGNGEILVQHFRP